MKTVLMWGVLVLVMLFLANENTLSDNATSPYEIIVKKNIFSPSRKYTPSGKSPRRQMVAPWKDVFLRGTFKQDHTWWAVFEVSFSFAQKWRLLHTKMILKVGQKLGPCEITQIASGEVTLGGSCGNVKMALSENPERRQPLKKLVPLKSRSPSKALKKSSKKPLSQTPSAFRKKKKIIDRE